MLNFNVDPYYDDFDPNKNFHRILFKPGRAVQARELTQAQTILQDQVSKFADHIFKQNTPVTGGQVTINNRSTYLKLNATYNDNDIVAEDFQNEIITNTDGTVFAKVVATEEAVSGDPPTLFITYLSGSKFSAGDLILSSSGTTAQIAPTDFTGFATTASISEGVFYIVNGYSFSSVQNDDGTYSRYSIGNFVSVQPQTIVVQKYGNTPTRRVGLDISEYVTDYVTDPSLLDPAIGATNYQAPGADRYTIKLSLTTLPLSPGADSNFIELVRITNGIVQRLVNGTVYATIDDYIAKRTYDTNGDFIVTDFKLVPKANTANVDTYKLQIGPGSAYIKGYKVESVRDITLEAPRAREYETLNNNNLTTDYGNYIYVNNISGAFDATKVILVDFHTINVNSSIVTTNSTTYNSTKAGSAYLRGLEYETASDAANTQSYVYKAYLSEFKNSTLSTNAAATGTTTTIQLFDTNGKFSSVANAYYGATVTIDSGTSAGDRRKIVAYNGGTKTATVDVAFTVIPDTTSNVTIRFGVENYNMMVAPTSSGFNRSASAGVDPSSKTDGIVSGVSILPTVLTNPTSPELIFPVGYDYVKNLSDQTYNSWKMLRDVSFSSGVAQFTLTGDVTFVGTASATQSSTEARNNWLVIATAPGSSGLTSGQPVNFTSANTIALDSTKKIATLDTTGTATFTGTILARTAITNAGTTALALKAKNLISGNTANVNLTGTDVGGVKVDLAQGQVYYPSTTLVTPGNAQSLYISDVKNIVKIIDTGAPTTAATDAMLSSSAYDVTNNFLFDNGQNDTYYGHASITLKRGAPQPRGNLLVVLNYYQHTGGDGYFCINSYQSAGAGGVSTSPENYSDIGSYTAKISGQTYNLRDCIDFRLSTVNATATLQFRYSTSTPSIDGALIPVDSGTFISDYSHYLGRNDIVALTKDNQFKLIQGKSSNAPSFPLQPDGSLLLAQITLDPYTSYLPEETTKYLPNISLNKIQHRRWRMQDISSLETRINNIEYYTSLSLLEKQAAELQVPDSNGLNRFKNGILVDNFTGFSTADAENEDFAAKINKRLTFMTAQDFVLNAPLFPKDGFNAFGKLAESAQTSLSYRYHTTSGGTSAIITLPYSSANLAVQKLASDTVSLNPFAVDIQEGVLEINPPMDMWVSTGREPDILIVNPQTTLFRQGNTLNVLSTGDWGTIAGTQRTIEESSGRQVTTTVYTNQERQTVSGNYDQVTSITGNFITDVSVQPYIRAQNLILRAKGMKINTPVSVFFDGENVNQYLVQPNIINLTNVNGTFEEDDVIGFYSSGTFYPTGRVVGATKTSPTTVRLYVSSDANTITYSSTNNLQNARFNQNGVYTGNTAFGTYTNSALRVISMSGEVKGSSGGSTATLPGGGTYRTGATAITLCPLSSSTTSFYVGSTIRITTVNQKLITKRIKIGTTPDFCDEWNCWGSQDIFGTETSYETWTETFTATITAYDGTTKVATLSSAVGISSGSNRTQPDSPTVLIGSKYSISGSTYLLSQSSTLDVAPRLSTDENGNFSAIFQLPGGTFRTGDKVLRIDNRTTDANPDSATTVSEGIFTASSLATKSVNVNFGGSVQAAAKGSVFVSTEQRFNQIISQTVTTVDPVAQTFMIDQETYPNGAFLRSIKVFFRNKPSSASAPPVKFFVTGTLNGYPNGEVLDNSLVVKTVGEINASTTPHYLDSSTYTEFVFNAPVYIRSGNLYAFILQTTSPDYVVWVAKQNSVAVASSVKNLPTDPTPSTITKIGASPYVGTLFESQNGIAWTAEQAKSLMFVIDNCVFTTSAEPTVDFIVPRKIPLRKLVNSDIEYYANVASNTLSSTDSTYFLKDLPYDALNVSVVDFEPTDTKINYTYRPTIYSDFSSDSTKEIIPGKYATSMSDNIYFDDGKGSRVLDSNSSSSFILTARLTTTNQYVSPVITDDGTSLYAIRNVINDMPVTNTDITVTSGNTAGVTAVYTSTPPAVTISAPTGLGGTQAYATANVVSNGSGGYIVDKINVTTPGSGYIQTPTLTIAANGGGYSATATISGETSARDGNGVCRYITKKVVLTPENDSGDLRVYYTAYKPVGSRILVYYKILNRNDTEKFEDQNWQLMTEINPGGSSYSTIRTDVKEYVSAPGSNGNADNSISYTSTSGVTYTQFSQFAIKIVLATADSGRTPVLYDLRVLALPSGQ